MAAEHVVFLFDVDNTLIDNDHIVADMKSNLERDIGNDQQQRYWDYFEELRTELGYADYLGALQRYRVEHPRDTGVLGISLYLLHYPFAERVYPGAFELIDSATTTADKVERHLDHSRLRGGGGEPSHEVLVTDVPAHFHEVAANLFGEAIEAQEVRIWEESKA